MKKYQLIYVCNRNDRQLQALIDIPAWGVKAGDLGGTIWSHKNLSHDGDCWVARDGYIDSNSEVSGDILVPSGISVMDNLCLHGGHIRLTPIMGEEFWTPERLRHLTERGQLPAGIQWRHKTILERLLRI